MRLDKVALIEFYDLEPMMHVVWIFGERQTGAILDHCFEAVM